MNVLDFFDKAVDNNPDKIALSDIQEEVSYQELRNRCHRIGSYLLERLSGKNQPIVVLIDRDVASLTCLLGITHSGNFYIPIDVSQPLARLSIMLENINPAALITVNGNMPQDLAPIVTCPVYDYQDMLVQEACEDLLAGVKAAIIDTDPLYAIYTSGSTGVPKGVLIAHRSVLDFIPVFTETFGLTGEDVFGNQAPFDFDVSVKDIYSSLYLGASIFIIPRVCFAMPKKLVEALDERRITVIVWAVSAMCVAAGFNVFKHRVPSALRRIMFSGEVMPIKMLNVWRKYIPDAMYVNLYGPTEITCNCTYHILDEGREYELTDKLPLGIPFRNEEVLVLNEGRPIGVGETGELCVRGTCLSLGYYNNPKKTAEVFIQNPLNTMYEEKIYCTGDLVELKEDGQYYFAGRKDFQIKHMGHRIELEEIELSFNAVPGVERSCCLFDEKRNKILGVYKGEADSKFIVETMMASLPKYMIPNIIEQIEDMPLTKNGKIDRKAIREAFLG